MNAGPRSKALPGCPRAEAVALELESDRRVWGVIFGIAALTALSIVTVFSVAIG
jgi:hypothetical protein